MKTLVSVNISDIASYMNATIDSSNFTFQGQSISSGSVNTHISAAQDYFRMVLGVDLADSNITEWSSAASGTQIQNQVKIAAWDYIAFRLCTLLAGGVVTGGFNYTLGELRKDRTEAWREGFRALIEGFRDSAKEKIERLTLLSYSSDADSLDISDGAPSMY